MVTTREMVESAVHAAYERQMLSDGWCAKVEYDPTKDEMHGTAYPSSTWETEGARRAILDKCRL